MSTKIFPMLPVLPSFAWPGGYDLTYFAEVFEGPKERPYRQQVVTLCPACANEYQKRREWTPNDHVEKIGQIQGRCNWEGPDEFCDECSKVLPSVYGDPLSEDTNDEHNA